MIKKIVAFLLLVVIALTGVCLAPERADAAKKKKKPVYRKHFKKRSKSRYFRKRITYRTYQEYSLSPIVKIEDEPLIIETLKNRGVSSARIDTATNSLILQFSSQIISALDIMKVLRDFGYTVTSIN